MEKVTINGKKYMFTSAYFDSPKLLKSFNVLARDNFDFELEEWDDPSYIPYALLDGEKIVSNVAVQKITFECNGNRYKGVQILTVMTDSEYRKKGLSSYLMNRVIKEWEDPCDLIYLFANDEAREFYPRFGFTKGNETVHYSEELPTLNNMNVVQLDLKNDDHKELMQRSINEGFACTSFPALDAFGIVEWICEDGYSDQLFFLEELGALAVAKRENNTLHLHGVFSESEFSLSDVIAALNNEEVERVELGFTPTDVERFATKHREVEGSTFYIYKDSPELFSSHTVRFPILTCP